MKPSRLFSTLAAGMLLATAAQAELKVAALHPLIGDLARQVGGKNITVTDLLKPGGDSHHFEPTSKDLAGVKGVSLVLASGKHLESFLDKLGDSLGPGVKIVEVGKLIPSLKISADSEVFMCCPAHVAGGIDPHWWHSAENMRRAARILADEFSAADPANKDAYKANAAATEAKFVELKSWAQQQIATIPRDQRKLVTAHSAFGYFCKEYGFKSLPLLGLGREDEVSAQYIVEAIKMIRDHKIRAVFPEDQANPKVLAQITRETGAKVGKELVADGTSIHAHTFEAMLKHNVSAIVEALK